MASGESYRLELRVGLLLIAGIIALVGVILVSERFSFEGDYEVTAYLRDAGGLRVGSPVTLAGLPIGKVKAIVTDSGDAGYPVRVTMAIKDTYRLPASFELTVATAGIFGDAYLAFAGTKVADTDHELLPRDGTAEVRAARGVIESATQQGLRLLSSVNELVDEEARADIKRMLRATADLAEESTALARQFREQTTGISETLARLDRTIEGIDAARAALVPRIEASLARLDQIGGRLQPAMDQAQATLGSVERTSDAVRGLVADNGGEIQALLADLRASLASVRTVADQVKDGEGLLQRLISDRALAEDVDRMAMNLVTLSDFILLHPEALVFGMSEEERIHWRQQRDRLRMRRAFNEGFRAAPEPGLPKPTLLEQSQRP